MLALTCLIKIRYHSIQKTAHVDLPETFFSIVNCIHYNLSVSFSEREHGCRNTKYKILMDICDTYFVILSWSLFFVNFQNIHLLLIQAILHFLVRWRSYRNHYLYVFNKSIIWIFKIHRCCCWWTTWCMFCNCFVLCTDCMQSKVSNIV